MSSIIMCDEEGGDVCLPQDNMAFNYAALSHVTNLLKESNNIKSETKAIAL